MDFGIDDIIKKINEKGIWDRCEQHYNNHLINYKLSTNSLENDDQCHELFDDFMTEIFYKDKKNEVDAQDRRIFGMIGIGQFKKLYRDKATKIVFDKMKTGTDGGVYGILKQLTNLMIDDIATSRIKTTIGDFISDLDFEDHIKLAKEYIKKYPKYLPNSYLTNPIIVAIKLYEILVEHIKIEKEIKNTVY